MKNPLQFLRWLLLLVCFASLTNPSRAQAAPCDYDNHVSLLTTPIPCNDVKVTLQVDPGYQASFTRWTVNGVPVSGTSLETILSGYPKGTYTVCAITMGGLTSEPDNLCCTKICIQVTIPGVDTVNKVVTYCPLAYPLGPWYNPCTECNGYYEFYKGGSLYATSAQGCISYLLDAPPMMMKCYETINGVRCLRKVVNITTQPMLVVGSSAPDINLQDCGGGAQFTPGCSSPYTYFEINGTGGYHQEGPLPAASSLTLTVGTYVLKCYDFVNCTYLETNVIVNAAFMVGTSCNVSLTSCAQIEDEAYIASQLSLCPGCQNTILGADDMSDWSQLSYDENTGVLVLQRTYYDYDNCVFCTVTFTISNQVVPETDIDLYLTQEPCTTLVSSQLIPCLQGKTDLVLYVEGHPEAAEDIGSGDITLCCDNIGGHQNTHFILYSKSDPCCFQRFFLICVPFAPPPQDGGNNGGQDKPAKEQNELTLVPNPTSSVFRIASSQGYQKYDLVNVMDANGKTLISRRDVDSKTWIDLSVHPEGIYFVRVTTPAGTVSLKLTAIKE